MSHLTQSEENYIKAIYHLQHKLKGSVGTNTLAERTNTKASSVTDMVRRLAGKSLLNYTKYQGCELTETGREIAKKTIRKHRLWETFLVDKLNFGWDEVHDIAEQLEHIQSIELTNRLDEFLNYPKFDPHGDPIPSADGSIQRREETLPLNQLKKDVKAIIIGVSDSSTSFLKFLNKYSIQLGNPVKILEHFKFDNSVEIELNASKLNLSQEAANKITVQIVD